MNGPSEKALTINLPSGPVHEGSPEFDAEVRAMVDRCEEDPTYENRVLEPLAGFFWPSVQRVLNAERARRAAS